jgi:hypothetical protein
MKTSCLVIALLASTLVWGQTRTTGTGTTTTAKKTALPKPTPYSVVQRGANDRVWERATYERTPYGTIVPKKHQYTELATGMHYWNNGQWVESKEQIDILPQGGAAATQGQHKVNFPSDIYKGVIEVVTPDGQHLKSRPVGISYDDGTKTVLIAELKDSGGLQTALNQVVYPDAFAGFKADLRYTYRRDGFEQDIVLREQPPSPESLGLNPETTKLEVLTEFFNAPEPATVRGKTDKKDGLTDTTLAFGRMKMGQGKAFSIGDAKTRTKIPVYKSWERLQGRTFLVEEVSGRQVDSQLEQLPAPASANATASPVDSILNKISATRLLPSIHMVQTSTNSMQVARADWNQKPGVVLDYSIVESQSDFTFQSDTTYYVGNSVNLDGTTVIEGGTVLKYDTNYTCAVNILGTVQCETAPYRPAILTSVGDDTAGEPISAGNGSSCSCYGTLDITVFNCLDSGEDLTVYISDDNGNYLVNGGTVSGGIRNYTDFSFAAGLGQHFFVDSYDTDGNEYYYDLYAEEVGGDLSLEGGPQQWDYYYREDTVDPLCIPPVYASLGLSLANGGSLNDLHIRNLGAGVQSAGNCSVTNIQFVQCGTAFDTENATLYAGNILMSYVGTGFYGQEFQATAENLTFDQGSYLTWNPGSDADSWVSLANSLVTGVSGCGNVPVYTNAVVTLPTGTGVYQMVGAGSYYLATNSPYHSAGTTSINPQLLAELQERTTYPPVVYSNMTISATTTFSPQARRDTNAAPDLGYHYDPIDYFFGGVTALSNLTFTAGTAFGWFPLPGSGWEAVGISLSNGIVATFNGTVTGPCTVAHCATVQEGDGLWEDNGGLGAFAGGGSYAPANPGQLTAQFTRFSNLASGMNFRDGPSGEPLMVHARDCEIYEPSGGYNLLLAFTNCLFYRGAIGQATADSAYSGETYREIYRNCTFYGGNLNWTHWEGAPYWRVSVRDCSFDQGVVFNISAPNNAWLDDGYNAYLTSSAQLPASVGYDVIVPGFNWQSSWFGSFYLPSNSPLIDAGGITADKVGLYHFTTQADQVPEGTSIVDIGYHYVATDQYGNPLDTNGDGILDYLEDANGDGVFDAGDLGDWLVSPYNGLTRTNGLQVFTPLK